MSLIVCPECGKEMSDTSKVCIHCGFRRKNSSKQTLLIIIALLLQLTAIILSVAEIPVYRLEEYNKHTYLSGWGPDLEYSEYENVNNEAEYSNILLSLNETSCPAVHVESGLEIISYITIFVMILGLAAYTYVLLTSREISHHWIIPLIAAIVLLVHSIVISIPKLWMIDGSGYYIASPYAGWWAIIGSEITAGILGKLSAKKKCSKSDSTGENDISGSSYVDNRGRYIGADLISDIPENEE